MKAKRTHKIFSIETTIDLRLSLQSVKKDLESFGIKNFNLATIKSEKFLTTFKSWSPDKQNEFIVKLGGPTNIYETRKFLETKEFLKIK